MSRQAALFVALFLSTALFAAEAQQAQAQMRIIPHVTRTGGGFDFSLDPLPADFFGPGSLPFGGFVDIGEGGIIDIETQTDPLPNQTTTVPIEIVALSLQSAQPITVEFSSAAPQLWDVFITLAPSTTNSGQAMVTDTGSGGGTYTAGFQFQNPIITFTQVNGSGTQVLPLGPVGFQLINPVPAPWVDLKPGTPALELFPTAVMTFQDQFAFGTLVAEALPEPTSLALLAMGGLAIARRRR